MTDIQHARVCSNCQRETFAFERCHHCGDCHWQ